MNIVQRVRRLFMPTCEEVNQFLASYLEGSLDPSVSKKYEGHVRRCSQCRAYIDQYRATIALTHEAGAAMLKDVPPELVDATLAFLRAHFDDQAGAS